MRSVHGFFRMFDKPNHLERYVDVCALAPEVNISAEARFSQLASSLDLVLLYGDLFLV